MQCQPSPTRQREEMATDTNNRLMPQHRSCKSCTVLLSALLKRSGCRSRPNLYRCRAFSNCIFTNHLGKDDQTCLSILPDRPFDRDVVMEYCKVPSRYSERSPKPRRSPNIDQTRRSLGFHNRLETHRSELRATAYQDWVSCGWKTGL